MASVEVKANDLAKRIDLKVRVRVRGWRWWVWRVGVACWAIKLAAWLMGVGVEIKADVDHK